MGEPFYLAEHTEARFNVSALFIVLLDLLRNNSLPRPTGAYFLGVNVTVVDLC